MPCETADSLVNRHVSEHDLFSMEETGSITFRQASLQSLQKRLRHRLRVNSDHGSDGFLPLPSDRLLAANRTDSASPTRSLILRNTDLVASPGFQNVFL